MQDCPMNGTDNSLSWHDTSQATLSTLFTPQSDCLQWSMTTGQGHLNGQMQQQLHVVTAARYDSEISPAKHCCYENEAHDVS